MIIKLLSADFLKIRRKGLWFLTFLGPFGVVALQMVNYGFERIIYSSRVTIIGNITYGM